MGEDFLPFRSDLKTIFSAVFIEKCPFFVFSLKKSVSIAHSTNFLNMLSPSKYDPSEPNDRIP